MLSLYCTQNSQTNGWGDKVCNVVHRLRSATWRYGQQKHTRTVAKKKPNKSTPIT